MYKVFDNFQPDLLSLGVFALLYGIPGPIECVRDKVHWSCQLRVHV